MCEDASLCTHFKYHKHKIIHFLSSMRFFGDYLKEKGKDVHYFEFGPQPHFLEKLESIIIALKIEKIQIYEVEDKFFEDQLFRFFESKNIEMEVLHSPMFICRRDEFKHYLGEVKKPFLNNFYIRMRKKHNILLEYGEPTGGKWNYDSSNRKKIPKKFEVDDFRPPKIESTYVDEVCKIVDEHFSDHPGETSNYWIPIDRKSSIEWFKTYLEERFVHFGDYQDAIDIRAPFLYHSVISPMVNIGFITPDEVIREVLKYLNEDNLNSVEGFIRQVLGWREFVRGIYQNYDEVQQKDNFFDHHKKLTDDWYEGTTGIPPVDDAIQKAQEWGYCHHIERLMVVGNIMVLLEIHPQEVFKWFMEMFVDSSDWVMGPNVFGMSQFSDGGIFATKPYICGSNYLRKMSHYKKGDWCTEVDGLYWTFIEKHQNFFRKNHRLSMMVSLLGKMDGERMQNLRMSAAACRNRLTV